MCSAWICAREPNRGCRGLSTAASRPSPSIAICADMKQEIAGLHRVRLVTKRGRNAGVDVAFLRGAAGLGRQHVDLDRAVAGRQPVRDAGNDRQRRPRRAYGRVSNPPLHPREPRTRFGPAGR